VIYAINSKSGKMKWRFYPEVPQLDQLALWKNTLFTIYKDEYIVGIDKDNGEIVFKIKLKHCLSDSNDSQIKSWMRQSLNTSIVVGKNGTLVLSSHDGIYAYSLLNDLVWHNNSRGPVGEEPTRCGDSVLLITFHYTDNEYMKGYYLLCLNLDDGRLKWENRFDSITTKVTISGDMGYFGCLREMAAVDLQTGKARWKYKTKGKIYKAPAVNSRFVCFGTTDNDVYFLDKNTGEELGKYETDGYVQCSPVIRNDIVYFGNDEGCLFALQTSFD
jgi:outer membrane protein assembly factor BamB